MKRSLKEQNGTNSTDMRFSNKLLILNILRKQSLSRSELARQMGLSRAGITILVEDLLQAEILQEVGISKAELGRRPMMLRIRADSFYAIGVSLTRRDCNIGILNIEGEFLTKQSVALPKEYKASELISMLCSEAREMVKNSNVDTDRILGVGISTPGPVDVENGRVLSSDRFNKWSNVAIVEEMDALLPWHCYLQNTSIARTMLEKNYGAGLPYKDFVYIKVADAIGGGVVIGDTLHTGLGQFGNEVGHMTIQFDGERCICGNVGCLALYAAIPALLKRFASAGFDSWKQVVDEAYQGNSSALKIVQAESNYLAAAVVSIANLLEPEAFILAGDIDYRNNLLLSLVREQVDTTRMMRGKHNIDIVGANITQDADLLAAATIIVEKFYQGEFPL